MPALTGGKDRKMTQPENGGVQAADVQPNGGADIDIQTQLDEMKAQLEALKKRVQAKTRLFLSTKKKSRQHL